VRGPAALTREWRHDLGLGQDFDSFRAVHGAIPVADGSALSAPAYAVGAGSWREGNFILDEDMGRLLASDN
jgi:hypothetical protein